MKVLKKQGLTLFLIVALVATLTLGIIFALPARNTASAEEEFVPANTVTVSTEQALKDEVRKAGATATKIILDDDIEMNSITCGDPGTKYYELRVVRGQNIQLDLAGHTLSAALNVSALYTIMNAGTLSIIDSSGDYSGAVVSNGCISHRSNSEQYIWYPTQVIENYGILTVDANIKFVKPDSAEVGEDGYYTGCGMNSSPLINNQLYIPEPEESNQNIYPVSLTVNGGNFELFYLSYESGSYGGIDHLFVLQGADLTINGGKFFNWRPNNPGYSENPHYVSNSGFLAELTSMSKQSAEIEAKILEHRHLDITINGGDFVDMGPKNAALVYVHSYADGSGYKAKIEGEGYTIRITDGTFACDFSAYVDADHSMVEEVITENEGQTVVKSYWVVRELTQVEKENAVAVIKQNNEITGYYASFGAAWNAVRRLPGDRTIELRTNAYSVPITTGTYPGNVIVDLNGHTLTITNDGKTLHIDNGSSSKTESAYNTLTFTNSSKDAEGELCLYYPEGSTGGGIYMGNATLLTLDGITLRRTGFLRSVFTGDSYGDKRKVTALFVHSNSYLAYRENAIVVRGGKILSEMTLTDTDNESIGSGTGDFFAWYRDNNDVPDYHSYNKWDYAYDNQGDVPAQYDKKSTFVLDLSGLKEDEGMRTSWDLSYFLPEGYSCNQSGDSYIITKTTSTDNYFSGDAPHETWEAALAAAEAGDKRITLLHNVDETEIGDIEIPAGITLDLNRYLNYTFAATNVTVNDGSVLMNGTIDANVIVKGKATFSKLTVKKELTINDGVDFMITDGAYDGKITVNGQGKLLITGGKFAETTAVETYDKYIQPGFGATSVIGGYRLVKAGVASLAALDWYSRGVKPAAAEAGTVFTINSTDEWLYFSSIVNSSTDNFAKCTVVLADSLDFADSIFIPAGTAGHGFAGAFDGGGNTMSHITAQEQYAGLFGVGESSIKVTDITVENSTFTSGHGYLDEITTDWGWGAAGSIVGAGFIGQSSQLTISGNDIDTDYGYAFLGGVIGHTFGSINLKDVSMTGSSVKQSWKSGGVVGYVESGLYLEDLNVSGLEFTGTSGGWCPSGVLAGDLNSSKATVTNATIDCPDLRLNGSSSCGVEVTVEGTKTDIHVDSLGTAGKFDFTLSADETDSAQLQIGSALPSNATVKDAEGKDITREENPDGDGFIMQAAPKNVEVFYGDGEIRGSYETFEAALAEAEDGDRIYLKDDLEENVTLNGKDVTINLYTHTLTGTITVESGTLTLENGTVKGLVANEGGTLKLAAGEKGLIIENTEAAVTGDYTVEGEACVRKTMSGETLTRLELALEHDNNKYTADGNSIIVSCTYCDHEAGKITLTAENFTYDGKTHEAKVTVEPEELMAAPAIAYKYSATENGNYEELVGLPTASGYYEASISVNGVTVTVKFASSQMAVIVSDITVGTVTYGDTAVEATNFTLKTTDGEELSTAGITLMVTLKESNYSVGKQIALITALTLGGEAAGNYTLATVGQQAFMETEITVAARKLYVRVNENGEVTYDGFVNGEDESVLSGELVLERNGNVVTPSGLSSTNYEIIFESGILANAETDLTALWVALAVVGAAAVVATGLYFGLRRKKQ